MTPSFGLVGKTKGNAVLWFAYPKGTSKKYRAMLGIDAPGRHGM